MIFSGCQIAVDFSRKWNFKEKQVFREKIQRNGGTVTSILNKSTSFLVLTDPENQRGSYKCDTASRCQVPVVLPSFIDACLDSGALVDHEPFLATGSTKMEAFSEGRIIGAKVTSGNIAKRQKDIPTHKLHSWAMDLRSFPWRSSAAPEFDEDGYEVAKGITLTKEVPRVVTTLRTSLFGMNKNVQPVQPTPKITEFFTMEIHVSPKKSFKYRYRVFTHHGTVPDSQSDVSEFGIWNCSYYETAEEALFVYSQYYNRNTHPSKGYSPSRGMVHPSLGSPRYKEYMRDVMLCGEDLTPAVSRLVEDLWTEALGQVKEQLITPLNRLTLAKVEEAEAVLIDIRDFLRENGNQDTDSDYEHVETEADTENKLQTLSEEFYRALPLKHPEQIHLMEQVARLTNLCQLLRDLLYVQESILSGAPGDLGPAGYFALRCRITHLSSKEEDFAKVQHLVEQHNKGLDGVQVKSIYRINRSVEDHQFNEDLGNHQLLLHATAPQNLVGILSRGLLMPKVVVNDYGGSRSGLGMLGDGIYFSDSAVTCSKYSQLSGHSECRYLLIHEVALGNCLSTYTSDPECQGPPLGYDSLRGVQATPDTASDFTDNEYVIYRKSQQRIRYLVEFKCTADKSHTPAQDMRMSNNAVFGKKAVSPDWRSKLSNLEDLMYKPVDPCRQKIDLSDIQNVKDPMDNVQLGLITKNKVKVTLNEVHIRARMLDIVAKVVVLQSYTNSSPEAVEAQYVFAVDHQAVVSGFEAFINGKHVVGEVKEKEEARAEYRAAVKAGHGAYLMEQKGETPEVSTVTVGNLPPGASVLIKVTYLTELPMDGESTVFCLPSSIATWRHNEELFTHSQTGLDSVQVTRPRDVSLQVAIEMPSTILYIKSTSHKIMIKQTDTKAVVALAKNESLDSQFCLRVAVDRAHVPRMWVERHPESDDSRACMLAFYPEFDSPSPVVSEVIFLLDLSNSMSAPDVEAAIQVLLLSLHHCPTSWFFNVVIFGTGFIELFPRSQQNTKQNRQLAASFLQGPERHCGNTEVYRALRQYFLLQPPEGSVRNVFILSDGHVNNEDAVLQAVYDNRAHTRIFTMGLGSSCNKHFLQKLAQNGAGSFSYFDSSRKSRWETEVQDKVKQVAQPVLTSVSVEWEQYGEGRRPVQAPQHINSLFSGSRLVVFGFVPNCTQATLNAEIDGKAVTTLVSTPELCITTGKMLHQLTARSVVRDWEDGLLNKDKTLNMVAKKKRKKSVINLSKKYTIASQCTSFVAVEKRSGDEVVKGPSLKELINSEDLDMLSYMGWEKSSPESDLQDHEKSNNDNAEKDNVHSIEENKSEITSVTAQTRESPEKKQDQNINIPNTRDKDKDGRSITDKLDGIALVSDYGPDGQEGEHSDTGTLEETTQSNAAVGELRNASELTVDGSPIPRMLFGSNQTPSPGSATQRALFGENRGDKETDQINLKSGTNYQSNTAFGSSERQSCVTTEGGVFRASTKQTSIIGGPAQTSALFGSSETASTRSGTGFGQSTGNGQSTAFGSSERKSCVTTEGGVFGASTKQTSIIGGPAQTSALFGSSETASTRSGTGFGQSTGLLGTASQASGLFGSSEAKIVTETTKTGNETAMSLFGASTQQKSLFGGPAQTSGQFGRSQAASFGSRSGAGTGTLFSSSVTTTDNETGGSLFGASTQQKSLFGGPAQTSGQFGSSQAADFGSGFDSGHSTGLFGRVSQGGGLFGRFERESSTQATKTGNEAVKGLFGGPIQTSGLCGSSQAASFGSGTDAGTGTVLSSSDTTTSKETGGSLFGTSAEKKSPFPGPPQAGGLFGSSQAASTAHSSGLFGTASQESGLFGSSETESSTKTRGDIVEKDTSLPNEPSGSASQSSTMFCKTNNNDASEAGGVSTLQNSLFGAPAQSIGLFGSSQASSNRSRTGFAQCTGLFGTASQGTGLFGSSKTVSANQPSGPLSEDVTDDACFGDDIDEKDTDPKNNGSPQTSTVFSSADAKTAIETEGSLFGGSVKQKSLFGEPAQTSGLFGSSQAASFGSGTDAGANTVFSSSDTNTGKETEGSLFGASAKEKIIFPGPPQARGLFGSSQTASFGNGTGADQSRGRLWTASHCAAWIGSSETRVEKDTGQPNGPSGSASQSSTVTDDACFGDDIDEKDTDPKNNGSPQTSTVFSSADAKTAIETDGSLFGGSVKQKSPFGAPVQTSEQFGSSDAASFGSGSGIGVGTGTVSSSFGTNTGNGTEESLFGASQTAHFGSGSESGQSTGLFGTASQGSGLFGSFERESSTQTAKTGNGTTDEEKQVTSPKTEEDENKAGGTPSGTVEDSTKIVQTSSGFGSAFGSQTPQRSAGFGFAFGSQTRQTSAISGSAFVSQPQQTSAVSGSTFGSETSETFTGFRPTFGSQPPQTTVGFGSTSGSQPHQVCTEFGSASASQPSQASAGFGSTFGSKPSQASLFGSTLGSKSPEAHGEFGSDFGSQPLPVLAGGGTDFRSQHLQTSAGFGSAFSHQPPQTSTGFGSGFGSQPPQTSSFSFTFGPKPPQASAGFGFTFGPKPPNTSAGFGSTFGPQPPEAPAGFGSGFGSQAPKASAGFGSAFGSQPPQGSTGLGSTFGSQPSQKPSLFGSTFGSQLPQASAGSGSTSGSHSPEAPAGIGSGFSSQPHKDSAGFGSAFGSQPPQASAGFGSRFSSQLPKDSARFGSTFGSKPPEAPAGFGSGFGSQPPKASAGFGSAFGSQPPQGSTGLGSTFGSQPPKDSAGFGSTFGSQPPEAPAGFGSGFGSQPPKASAGFGSTFGPQPSQGSTGLGSTFGSQPSQKTFGSTLGSQLQASAGFGSTFGPQPPQGTSGFGSGFQPPGTPAGFGSGFGSQLPKASARFGSTFGSQSTEASAGFGSTFGSQPSQKPSLFGSSLGSEPPQGSTGLGSTFGSQPSQTPSLFGSGFGSEPPQATAGFGSTFGSQSSQKPSLFGSGFGTQPPQTYAGFGSTFGSQPPQRTAGFGSAFGIGSRLSTDVPSVSPNQGAIRQSNYLAIINSMMDFVPPETSPLERQKFLLCIADLMCICRSQAQGLLSDSQANVSQDHSSTSGSFGLINQLANTSFTSRVIPTRTFTHSTVGTEKASKTSQLLQFVKCSQRKSSPLLEKGKEVEYVFGPLKKMDRGRIVTQDTTFISFEEHRALVYDFIQSLDMEQEQRRWLKESNDTEKRQPDLQNAPAIKQGINTKNSKVDATGQATPGQQRVITFGRRVLPTRTFTHSTVGTEKASATSQLLQFVKHSQRKSSPLLDKGREVECVSGPFNRVDRGRIVTQDSTFISFEEHRALVYDFIQSLDMEQEQRRWLKENNDTEKSQPDLQNTPAIQKGIDTKNSKVDATERATPAEQTVITFDKRKIEELPDTKPNPDTFNTSIQMQGGAKTEGIRLSEGDMVRLFKLQNDQGYWTLDLNLTDTLKWDTSKVLSGLLDAGLKSLGPEVSIEINRLVATLLVLAHVVSIKAERPVAAALADLLAVTHSSRVEQKLRVHRGYSNLSVFRAVTYCQQGIKSYASVCRQLELGSSWTDFVLKFM